MSNVGEQLVASYLKHKKFCDFTQTNVNTIHGDDGHQGEIDVIGLDMKNKKIYVCEVAIHLATGILYTKNGKSNNTEKLIAKFTRDISYAKQYFPEYDKEFMLWSPIIKNQKGKEENNQQLQVDSACNHIHERYGIKIQIISNAKFLEKMNDLRKFASTKTEEMSCPILRVMQIEEYLKKHLSKS